MLKQKR